MALITLRDISLHQGTVSLLDHVNLIIEPRERIALIGRNGMGKSTLMKLINREIEPDSGEVVYQNKVHVARLEQEVPQNTKGTIFSVIAEGLGVNPSDLPHLDWPLQAKVEKTLSILSLSGEDDFAALSGGMKRRVLLGRALVEGPSLLLLDEPTNHLDIESILWLEKFLLTYPAALLFITHDRAILKKLATRIIELDRGILTNFPGDYPTYLSRKNELLETESKHNALFDKKLAQEEIWIRQGIKARRTRNEGRVRALERLREERSERRECIGNVSMSVSMANRSGQLVLEAKNISHRFGGRLLVQNFSITIHRGDKIGVIGPNGCGKSTLLNILLGQLKPDSGEVRLGQSLQIAYFDQLREQLNPLKSVADNVMEGSTTIEINGEKKHIMSYLQNFLFAPERARGPVKVLSGGERNRLLLAKLFAKPSNLLIMDEPTNDLDAETLELLEELLADYKGTLIMVSHDRSFLNNVVTSTIAFEGEAQVYEYVGGYDDWQRQRRTKKTLPSITNASTAQSNALQIEKPKKLTFSEQHELKATEARIESIDLEKKALQIKMADPVFYQGPLDAQEQIFRDVQRLEDELEKLIARWEVLEARR